jgi:hypothetical protein
MVVVKNPEQYKLVRFQVCRDKKHKYNAILENKKTGKQKKVPFGGIKSDGTPYQHYHDKIGKYRKYDHGDKERRKRYVIRHKGEQLNKFSSGYFSMLYLW